MMLDRLLIAHIYLDGRISVIITCPDINLRISRHVYNRYPDPKAQADPWYYVLQLMTRADKEWQGLNYKFQVTYEQTSSAQSETSPVV